MIEGPFSGNHPPHFEGFFGAFVFSTLGFGLLFFPGGTHPHPQFSFLANGITSFPCLYR